MINPQLLSALLPPPRFPRESQAALLALLERFNVLVRLQDGFIIVVRLSGAEDCECEWRV